MTNYIYSLIYNYIPQISLLVVYIRIAEFSHKLYRIIFSGAVNRVVFEGEHFVPVNM